MPLRVTPAWLAAREKRLERLTGPAKAPERSHGAVLKPKRHSVRVGKVVSAPEELFAAQLTAEGISFCREVLMVEGRKWRLDFVVGSLAPFPCDGNLAVEIEGWGRHQRFKGFEEDCVKYAAALIAGWRVLRVTPSHVSKGLAIAWVKQALT